MSNAFEEQNSDGNKCSKHEYWYYDDLPDGHMIVTCMLCGTNFRTEDKLPDTKEKCPCCGAILSYPDGASW